MEETVSEVKDVAKEVVTPESNKLALVKLVPAGIVLIAFTILAVQNIANAEINFITWTFDVPKILLMVISALVGIVLWEIVTLLRRRKK